ncbi:hypothetical protein IJG90_04560 [Candidatus Saccharibacteria bacterium]|nr:hypothetical protein [Candidatus Saccharibacteria bacterium]
MNIKLKLAAGAILTLAGGLMGGSVFADTDTTYDSTVFTDEEFFTCIKATLNVTGDSITQEQAESLTTLACNYDIADFAGLDKLTNLTSIELDGLESAESIDFSANTKLETIEVLEGPNITEITLGAQENLETLVIQGTAITGIDLTEAPALTSINLYNNKIKSIDLSKNAELTTLVLSKNALTTIDLNNNEKLTIAYLYDNDIKSINIGKIYDTLGKLYLDDDVLVSTKFKAVQMEENGDYYASSSTNEDSSFIRLIVLTGLSTGDTKITTSGAKFSKTDCAANDASCIIIDADVADYQGFIELAYVGDEVNEALIEDGRDSSKMNYRVALSLEDWKEEESDVKVPDTGIFSGDSNGMIIAVSAGVVAAVMAIGYLAIYSGKRASSRGRFNR